MDEVLVHKVFVWQSGLRRNDVLTGIGFEPVLTIVRLGLIECQINTGIAVLAGIRIRADIELLEVVLSLGASRCSQSLIILDLPPVACTLLPLLILVLGVEGHGLGALGGLDDGSGHVGEEAGDCKESMPQLVKEVDEEATNMCAVVILVGHDEDAAVAKSTDIGILSA